MKVWFNYLLALVRLLFSFTVSFQHVRLAFGRLPVGVEQVPPCSRSWLPGVVSPVCGLQSAVTMIILICFDKQRHIGAQTCLTFSDVVDKLFKLTPVVRQQLHHLN